MSRSESPSTRPTPTRPLAQVLLCVATVVPSLLPAQTSTSAPFRFETFAARSESAAGSTFGGATLAGYSGLLGLRVSGAVAGLDLGGNDRYTTVPVRSCSRFGCRTVMANRYGDMSLFSSDAWSVDADLLLEPFRTAPVLRQLLLGFSPYGFVGVSRLQTNSGTITGADTARRLWSYGVGVHHDLISRVGVMGEARVRRALDDNSFVGGNLRNSVQYRVGLSFGLGGARKTSAAPVTIVSRGPIVTRPVPADRAPQVVSETDAPRDISASVPALLDNADALLGSPWRDGGTSVDGFDAGGFVQYVFAQEDIRLPRLVRELAVTGTSVSTRIGSLRPGDLLFFANDGMHPDHVGIYVGRDRFIHATASGNGVRYDVLGEGTRGAWFADHLYSARRLVSGRRGTSQPTAPTLTPAGRPDGAPRPVEVP